MEKSKIETLIQQKQQKHNLHLQEAFRLEGELRLLAEMLKEPEKKD